MISNKFKFFTDCEITKAKDASGNEVMKVAGIASSNSQDSQGETLNVNSFDLSAFNQINWNHKGSADAAAVIGEPTIAKVIDNNKLYVEGVLYNDVPMAKAVYGLMKAMKSSPSKRKLGMSIEGKVVSRASEDKKSPLYNVITKAKITGVAICANPINGDTVVDLLQKGYTKNEDELLYDDELEQEINKMEKSFLSELGGDDKKSLSKSAIYENINSYFSTINNEQAEAVYILAKKISTMENNPISNETLKKAYQILGVASNEIEKSEKTDKPAKKDDDEEEDVVIEGEKGIQKSLSDLTIGLNNKFSAMAELFQHQNEKIEALVADKVEKSEQIDDLKKSNGILVDKLNEILNVKIPSKSIQKADKIEKFDETIEKSTTKQFDISNLNERRNLIGVLNEASGINKAKNDGEFDRELAIFAQQIEVAGGATMTPSIKNKLNSMGVSIVKS